MSQPLALIIDDEPDIRELLCITLERMQVDSLAACNLDESRSLLKQHEFSICLTDLRLPDGDGVDFIRYLQKHYPQLPVAVITAHGSMETAIQALKLGAFDFLTKPVDLESLRAIVKNALNVHDAGFDPADRLVGESAAIRDLRKKIGKLARSQAPVYISGESGTGKELVARMIHDLGPRSARSFVPVNCGAIPMELMESEFFGHIKGSFTGAVSDKEGLFQAADGGTLFLDEVAELPQHIQVKLLRAIQEKKIRPVGTHTEIPVNIRLLSATHRNLGKLVEAGEFRQDLYFRINVIEIHVPPLRERSRDLPTLIDHILNRLVRDYSCDEVRMSDDALQKLLSYDYPGNVRELENILERAITLCEGEYIQLDDLELLNNANLVPAAGPEADGDFNLDNHMAEIEKQLILEALEKSRWNKTTAASCLGISFRSLRYRLKKLGLEDE
jgi:two-component system response regulator PilR (NtrC family)